MREVAAQPDVGDARGTPIPSSARGRRMQACRSSSLRACGRAPRERRALARAPRPAAASPRAPRAAHPGSASTSRELLRRLARSRAQRRGNRRPRESAGARAGGYGRCPARCSKRGCSAQISLIVASKRRGIAMRCACAVEHLVHRVEQRRDRLARRAPSPRSTAASTSCHSSVANRNAGDTRLAVAHARVGARERHLDEALAQRLLEDHVEQRQQAVCSPCSRRLAQRLGGVAGQQQLQHLVEQARRRHVRIERRELRDRLARSSGRSSRPSFAARRTARSMRTGSSR